MMFSRIEFWFFFPAVFVVHWLLPRRAAYQNAFLLVVGYLFYATWSPRLVPVLFVSTAVDYVAALVIDGNRARATIKKAALGASVVLNLGLLGYFKYEGFFADTLNHLGAAVGLGTSLPVLHLVLPLGLSFYTFQKLGYAIDVYYERIPACRSPLTFATFVAFFPQLIAGPITRGDELIPQIVAPRRLEVDRLSSAAATFLLGFVKKAYVADFLGRYVVDPVFANPAKVSTLGLWIALFGYGAQVFCDFSGYSEMAIGVARALGIELPINFDFPFLAKNVLEFWRRWHITLNKWFFDYIFGPLTTGEGFFRGRLSLGFLLVFLISGLWHGPKWTFVFWGAAHGVGLVIFHRWDVYYRGLCRKDRRWVAVRKSTRYVAGAWAITQAFFVLTLIPFRATSLGAAGRFAAGLVTWHGGPLLAGDEIPALRGMNLAVCFGFFVVYHLVGLAEVGRSSPPSRAFERFLGGPAIARGIVYGIVIVYLFVFVPASASSFVYAQF